jgi:putative copper export protein
MVYTILKFVHIGGMAVWFGGLFMMFTINRVLVGKGEMQAAQTIGRLGALLSTRLFMPAVAVVLITGIGLVQVGELSFSLAWVIWGMVGLATSVLIGAVFTGGAARKLGQAISRGEIDAAGIAAAQRRIMMFAILNMVLLLSVMWAMVAKPS